MMNVKKATGPVDIKKPGEKRWTHEPSENVPPWPKGGQELSPSIAAELRHACELLAIHVLEVARARENDGNPESTAKEKRETKPVKKVKSALRQSSSRYQDAANSVLHPPPYSHIPVHVAASFRNTMLRRNPVTAEEEIVINPDPLALMRIPSRPKPRSQGNPMVYQPTRLSAINPGRPVTSSGANGNQSSVSTGSSNENSGAGSMDDQPSTRLSSWSSPANERKSSPASNRVSGHAYPDPSSSTLAASVAAKTWMMQERSYRRPETSHGRLRQGTDRGSAASCQNSRPSSGRAGTMVGGVKDTIRDYMRPRLSLDTAHPTGSDLGLSRVQSRGRQEVPAANESGNAWWRGSGRKTWSSFRPARADEEGSSRLNQELPALPGLDQYREKRTSFMHVAQLMRVERPPPPPHDDRHPDDPALAESARIMRWTTEHSMMEERMNHHTNMASAAFGMHARRELGSLLTTASRDPSPQPSLREIAFASLEERERLPQPEVVTMVAVMEKNEKPGLRNRLKRLLVLSSSRDRKKGKQEMMKI